MEKTIISKIDTPKGIISIYTEVTEEKKVPRWIAAIALPGGLTFRMIESNSEISREEVLKMI